jgi:mycoredoxin
MSAAPALPSAGTITMFSTPWCGYCRGLRSALDREGISYNEIDIEHHRASAE